MHVRPTRAPDDLVPTSAGRGSLVLGVVLGAAFGALALAPLRPLLTGAGGTALADGPLRAGLAVVLAIGGAAAGWALTRRLAPAPAAGTPPRTGPGGWPVLVTGVIALLLSLMVWWRPHVSPYAQAVIFAFALVTGAAAITCLARTLSRPADGERRPLRCLVFVLGLAPMGMLAARALLGTAAGG